MKISKINKNIKIISRASDRSVNGLIKVFRNALKRLEIFYKIKISNLIVELVYSRSEFEEKISYKSTPSWLVAISKKNKVFLMSPSIMEKESCHKKREINKIVTHELCHVFNKKINKNTLMWVDEGMAQFLAGQKRVRVPDEKDLEIFYRNFFVKNVRLMEFSKNKGYEISYWIIKTLSKVLKRDGLIELIKISFREKL